MWAGLPDYGARLIRGFIESGAAEVHIVATRPTVPIQGMEQSLGQVVHWVDDASEITWQSLGIRVPEVLFQGGWAQTSFRSLAADARQQGAKVILMNDQNWQGGLRHLVVDPVLYRAKYLKQFEAAFVPGKSGARYARAMGFKSSRIAVGLYGADPAVFHGGSDLMLRPKTFLFVGQLIARKNILNLVQAFLNMAVDFPDWKLIICGSGELQSKILIHWQVQMQGFMQPQELAEKLRQSRCLILPSLEEHWGLVVHEAASCGCALALSDTVGSRDDFVAETFNPRDVKSMENVLRRIASWPDEQWNKTEDASRQAALKFGPTEFANSVQMLIDGILQ